MSEVVYLHLMWCQCANCGFKAKYEDLPPAKDVYERLGMGDTYSDVECPKCGALCFQCEPPPPSLSKPDSEGWWWCRWDVDKVVCVRMYLKEQKWFMCHEEGGENADAELDEEENVKCGVEWIKAKTPWE